MEGSVVEMGFQPNEVSGGVPNCLPEEKCVPESRCVPKLEVKVPRTPLIGGEMLLMTVGRWMEPFPGESVS